MIRICFFEDVDADVGVDVYVLVHVNVAPLYKYVHERIYIRMCTYLHQLICICIRNITKHTCGRK